MQQQPDDKFVIQMILQGQHSAYSTLVERYQAYVFTLVLRYVHDRGLAEELAQDVFVKAFRSLADFKGTSKFSTWLYTIVHTTCISALRKKKEQTVLLEHEQMLSLSGHMHSTENADDPLRQKAQTLALATAIATLPTDDAQIVTLFYQAEQTVEEISKIMGITPANVKVKLFRARQKLRETLKPEFS